MLKRPRADRSDRSKILQILILTVCLNLAASAGWAEELPQTTITPQAISIGAFFNGTHIKAEGHIPADSQAVIRITGHSGDLHLKQKGRAFGVLWMNLNTLTFENVPSVYLLYVPETFEQMLQAGSGIDSVSQLTLASLQKQVQISPKPDNKDQLFAEFLKLKKSEGLYAVHKDSFHYSDTNDGAKSFEASLKIPSRIKPGEYTLDLYAVKDGQITAHKSLDLPVKLAGFPAMLSSLAFQHGLLYGILATLAALFAGLLMGFFFSGAKAGH